MEKIAFRFLITLIITWMYCNVWMVLEKIIDGQVTNRLVDNIIMLLFIPIIYLATKSIVK